MALNIVTSLGLPESEFFPPVSGKSGIAIHHTVGGSARSSLEWWKKDTTKTGGRRRVGTAYIIDRDGTAFQIFDPAAWAFQFDLDWPPSKQIGFEKRFIGIELASLGGLIEDNGRLYSLDRVAADTEVSPKSAVDYGTPYRGYRYFHMYEPAQIDALAELVDYLCRKFAIPRRVPAFYFSYYGPSLADFEGIIGHAMVRDDNTDPAPNEAMWLRLIRQCSLEKVFTPKPGVIDDRPPEPPPALDDLFRENSRQIAALQLPAGSVVKGLLMELERRGTHIRLYNADPGGHTVDYEIVDGVANLVERLADALGFETVTESKLVVPHA